MNRYVAAICVLAAAGVASTAWSKGPTVRIEIRGSHPKETVEITDPEILGRFHIWNGPGVRINGKPVHRDADHQIGAFIDWPKGMLSSLPEGLRIYDVSFHIGLEPDVDHEYVVKYAFDPASHVGYMYLPTADEAPNTALIVHGVEGHWFYASDAWEESVRPVIERSIRS